MSWNEEEINGKRERDVDRNYFSYPAAASKKANVRSRNFELCGVKS